MIGPDSSLTQSMSTLLPPSGNGPHLPHGIRPPARSQAPLPPEAASAAAGVKPEKPSWPIVELVMGLMMVVVGLKLPADGALAPCVRSFSWGFAA